MLNTPINPFAAIVAFSVIAAVGTFFVVHQISKTDFTYAYETKNIDAMAP